jgi:hypothetical protein
MAAAIGIKLANGDFYSILEENLAVKKRLILTTVHDKQKSVQIDLYKSETRSMADALYIGSLVVDNISPKLKGEPSIELTLSSTAGGVISASSVDLGDSSKERQHLSLHLKSFEEDKNDYANFDMENQGNSGTRTISESGNRKRRFLWLIPIIAGLVLILILALLWFFLLRGKTSGAAPPADVDKSAVSESPAAPQSPVPEANPPPVIIDTPPKANPAPVNRDRSQAPVYSSNIPQSIPPEGVAYKINWGDTLWDISEAFYRNPRLYSRIVRRNRIPNPNLIISGTEIVIPPRN